MFAADTGSIANIKALLNAGADLNEKDNAGKTALDLARKSNFVGHEIRVRVLEEAANFKR
jgi:ankyrin repeat protein